ncbi:energy transducer TonB [bacterium]|nr:energy transducer TonB [bacterium]MCB2202334.1 energy transducer TonB [bacterium]
MVTIFRYLFVLCTLALCVSLAFAGPRGKGKKLVGTKTSYANDSTSRWQMSHPFMYLYPSLDEKSSPISAPEFISVPDLEASDTTELRGEYLVEVDHKGEVGAFLTERSAGNPKVDSLAVGWLLQCRFKPAQYHGEPVPAAMHAKLALIPSDSGYAVVSKFISSTGSGEKPPSDSVQSEEETNSLGGPHFGTDWWIPAEWDTAVEFPEMISQARPGMPEDFKRSVKPGGKADVWIRALISGVKETPLLVQIAKSSGWISCDIEALEASRECRFKPARKADGAAETCWVTFNYSFQISSR